MISDGQQVCEMDPAGTDPTCCAGNFKWTGCDFERYGFFGEGDALVGVSSLQRKKKKHEC